MQTATSILRNEHEAILKMLEATEQVARQLGSGNTVAADTLDGLVEFFKVFADRCHHGKEEDLLFPLLETKGLPRNGGPIGIMLQEHDMGRALVRTMAEASVELSAGKPGAGARWATAAHEYAALLRSHIMKENNILFAMAEQMLSTEEQIQLASDFEKVETEKLGPGTHERLHASMESLTASILG